MDRRHKLIVIDDLMHRVVQDKEMELLFTQGTHHRCVSVILITQNLYPGGKHARTIALNTWYTVLMKNLRDVSQVGILGRQLYPGRGKAFMKASSIRDGIVSFQDGRHGSKMAAMTPRWPPRPLVTWWRVRGASPCPRSR